MQEKDKIGVGRITFCPHQRLLTRMHPSIIPRNKQKKFSNDRDSGKRLQNWAHKQTKANPYARPTTGKCYGCPQTGHNSSDCPQRKEINIIEWGEHIKDCEEGDEFLCRPGGDNDGHNFDERQIYVVRKTMLVPKKEEMTQRHLLFRTRCTIKGNICNLIIDGGSKKIITGKSIDATVTSGETSKSLQHWMDQNSRKYPSNKKM